MESLVDCFVKVAVIDLVDLHAWHGGCHLGEFVAEVCALLVCALGGGRERCKLCVDLVKELG